MGRFYVNFNSDDDDDDHEPNVSGDARRAQEEANGNTAAQERDDGMDDDPDDDEMGTQGCTSGNVSEVEENEEDYCDNDMTARDIINSQQIAICLDEPREAQYMAGFIALQMSRMWGMFEAGDKRTIDAALKGASASACPYHNDLARYPNVTVLDCAGIVLPSSEEEISHSQSVRSRTFRSVEDRNQYIRFSATKCKGLHIFYKLWSAATILDVTKEEMKLLVSERKHPVGDIVYQCFSLALNCKYISFARTGLNLVKHGYEVDVSAIIAATDPGKCDGPLLHWCVRKGHWLADEHYKKYIRATPNATWTKNSVVVSLDWPLWTDLCDAEVDHRCIYGMVRARPHPLPATC